jgi:hypothetical protein
MLGHRPLPSVSSWTVERPRTKTPEGRQRWIVPTSPVRRHGNPVSVSKDSPVRLHGVRAVRSQAGRWTASPPASHRWLQSSDLAYWPLRADQVPTRRAITVSRWRGRHDGHGIRTSEEVPGPIGSSALSAEQISGNCFNNTPNITPRSRGLGPPPDRSETRSRGGWDCGTSNGSTSTSQPTSQPA